MGIPTKDTPNGHGGLRENTEMWFKEEKFAVKETPCHDGKIRATTYVTKKGLEYIRKLLRKDGYYDTEVA